MQLSLNFQGQRMPHDVLVIGQKVVPLLFLRNPRARRYILRVRSDGSARVTIPRGGTKSFALDFAQRHATWVEKQVAKVVLTARPPVPWTHETEILWRGELVKIFVDPGQRRIQLGEQNFFVRELGSDLRRVIEPYLRGVAIVELTRRTMELAALHNKTVRRVVVRRQRSRWGSCSAKGTVSLNWHLMQVPGWVCDYLIVHEIMHLQEMNHSRRFWTLVEAACPDYAAAEKWLDAHERLLRE